MAPFLFSLVSLFFSFLSLFFLFSFSFPCSYRTKLEVEISSHRESSKNADLALSRLRETLDRERDLQMESLTSEKSQMERMYKQKLHVEVERHQHVHSSLRLQLTAATETITSLEAKIRLSERERSSQLRSKDEELLGALETSRAENAEVHRATIDHYENTIADMQASLVATRAKLSELESKHARDVEDVSFFFFFFFF